MDPRGRTKRTPPKLIQNFGLGGNKGFEFHVAQVVRDPADDEALRAVPGAIPVLPSAQGRQRKVRNFPTPKNDMISHL